MARKRRQYRVKPSGNDGIDVAVPGSKKDLISGKIEDLSICGVRVLFKDGVPDYQLRDVIRLQIRADHLREPLAVHAFVSYRADEVKGRVYGFEFLDWLGLQSRLTPELKAFFNRRGDLRVRPDPERPLEAAVMVPPQSSRQRICVEEVSTSGLSFVARGEVEALLYDPPRIDLWLQLPDAPSELRFAAKIINRKLVHDGIRYGVFFLAEETEGFEALQEALTAYVGARRREILGLPRAAEQLRKLLTSQRTRAV